MKITKLSNEMAILSEIGNQEELGKPVGNDREIA